MHLVPASILRLGLGTTQSLSCNPASIPSKFFTAPVELSHGHFKVAGPCCCWVWKMGSPMTSRRLPQVCCCLCFCLLPKHWKLAAPCSNIIYVKFSTMQFFLHAQILAQSPEHTKHVPVQAPHGLSGGLPYTMESGSMASVSAKGVLMHSRIL